MCSGTWAFPPPSPAQARRRGRRRSQAGRQTGLTLSPGPPNLPPPDAKRIRRKDEKVKQPRTRLFALGTVFLVAVLGAMAPVLDAPAQEAAAEPASGATNTVEGANGAVPPVASANTRTIERRAPLKALRLLTLDEAVNLALTQNPEILAARERIKQARGVVVEVRSAAMPRLAAVTTFTQTDEYLNYSQPGVPQEEARGTPAIPIGPGLVIPASPPPRQRPNTDKPSNEQWDVQLRLEKLIFDAGGTRARIGAAKLDEEAAFFDFADTIQRVLYDTRVAFFRVLLNRSLITVREDSVQLLGEELDNQKRRFEAGTVPRFNVLRAEVELSNERPNLIAARNNYRISLNDLAKLTAVDYRAEDPLTPAVEAAGRLSDEARPIALEACLQSAALNRPLLKRLARTVQAEKSLINAEVSGYYPRLAGFGSYGYQHEQFADDLEKNDGGYVAGVEGRWDIFDGLETKGRVDQAKARYQGALLDFENTRRQVELEVRSAHSRYIESIELMESQVKNVEQAQEALRLAQSRFDAGTGTQLDILDARTSLTDAQSTELSARFDFNAALADIERATGTAVRFIVNGQTGPVPPDGQEPGPFDAAGLAPIPIPAPNGKAAPPAPVQSADPKPRPESNPNSKRR